MIGDTTVTHQFDDVKVGYDNNADGDILDAGDAIQVSDNFNSNAMSLSYDNNGNLTNDGLYQYVYDAWNRLRKVNRVAAGDTTTSATGGVGVSPANQRRQVRPQPRIRSARGER